MSEDSFPQAAARHLHDAKILLDKQRWDNAVYLAGYVVECSFKVLVEAEVLNVKILMILFKLCIGIGDTKFEQLMTLFSIDKGFYLGKTQTSSGFMAGFNTSVVEVYIPEGKTAVKKYGHDLTELQGKAIDRLRLMYPVLMQLPTSRTQGTVLDQYHSERRY